MVLGAKFRQPVIRSRLALEVCAWRWAGSVGIVWHCGIDGRKVRGSTGSFRIILTEDEVSPASPAIEDVVVHCLEKRRAGRAEPCKCANSRFHSVPSVAGREDIHILYRLAVTLAF